MTVYPAMISSSRRATWLAEVSARITEAEASTSARTATILLLASTGFNTSEAVQELWADMDALAVLRDVRRRL
ncbi:hypothetical protein ASG63_22080 [Methylobacterium sp. Leaf94]|nr:hypothetical protein ASG63_22080 [Methylobacterium sp. Leaf94]